MDVANFWFSGPAGDIGEGVGNTLRFRGDQYLQRTIPQTAVSSETTPQYETISFWVKFTNPWRSVGHSILTAIEDTGAYNYGDMVYYSKVGSNNAQKVGVFQDRGGNLTAKCNTSGNLRDTSGWYHVYITYDNGTNISPNPNDPNIHYTGIVKCYINGVLRGETNQNPDMTYWNGSAYEDTNIGIGWNTRRFNANERLEGYICAPQLIIDSIIPIDTFGRFNEDGVWVPVEVDPSTIDYGTNGWYLDFSDPTNIGKDISGNGNDFTAYNFELTDTTSVDYDWFRDNPVTNYPLYIPWVTYQGTMSPITTPRANMASLGGAKNKLGYVFQSYGQLPTNGKWLFLNQMPALDNVNNTMIVSTIVVPQIDVCNESNNAEDPTFGMCGSLRTNGYSDSGYDANATITCGVLSDGDRPDGDGNWWYSLSTQFGNTTVNEDAIGTVVTAWNGDTKELWFGFIAQGPGNENFTGEIIWMQNDNTPGGDPVEGTDPNFTLDDQLYAILYSISEGPGNNKQVWSQVINGAQVGYREANVPDVPGYKLINAEDCPAIPEVAREPEQNISLHFGEGTDFLQTTVFPKVPKGFYLTRGYDSAKDWKVIDSLRGTTSPIQAWQTPATTVLDDYSGGDSGQNVCLAFATPGDEQTLDTGTITSNVLVNKETGFSIISYTGTGVAGDTVAHGLDIAPSLVWVKCLTDSNRWTRVGSDFQGPQSSWDSTMGLNSNNSENNNANVFNGTHPTNEFVTLGNNDDSNGAGKEYIMYAWHSVPGLSQIGRYQGNGNANGTFTYTGFKPKFLVIKRYDGNAWWQIKIAGEIDPINPISKTLNFNDTGAISNSNPVDFYCNGFKITSNQSGTNSGYFLYFAFAEYPFIAPNMAASTAR